jgi:hypothetical protein
VLLPLPACQTVRVHPPCLCRLFFAAEPAFYYDFADAALVMIDACNLPEGQEFITVKDFSTILVGKGYSVDR